jgi:hypothetical protein
VSAPPVEVTTRYATTVDDLSAAWAFVMKTLEEVGPDPSVEISPIWLRPFDFAGDDDEPWPRQFSVVVSGMVEEKP